MASPIWRRGASHHSGLSFVACPPRQFVVLASSPDEHDVFTMHYLREENCSYPCMGPGACSYCPARRFEYAYAPCWLWNPSTKRFRKAILPIGDPGAPLATEDYTGRIVEVARRDESSRRSPLIVVKTFDLKAEDVQLASGTFDIRAHLLRRWGLYKEAELIGCELHVPTPEQIAAEKERVNHEQA